jgi:hypothetical protein
MAKTQNVLFRKDPWREYTGLPGNPIPGYDQGINYANGSQDLLVSFGHNYKKLGTGGDIGGPFHCVKRELEESNWTCKPYNRTVNHDGNSNAFTYEGKYYAETRAVSNSDFPSVPIPSNSELDALGTTAIARTIPTSPLVGLAVTLGEIRSEGIPKLIGADLTQERVRRARAAGSEYLNAEFGWFPLLNDVFAFTAAVTDHQQIIDRYVAESGRLLHRAYTFPDQISTTTSTGTAYPVPASKTGFWNGIGTKTTTTTTTVRQWFEGAFTYHLAPPGSVLREEQIAAKRFGLRITPEVLWNLTPWSWAADWVTNIGDVARNVSAFMNDGLVMPYGYMMKETSIKKTVHNTGAITKYGQHRVSCHQSFTTTRKIRRKATPFGFGLNLTSFTSRQWAILAALGLSKGNGQMKYQ